MLGDIAGWVGGDGACSAGSLTVNTMYQKM